MWPKQGAHHPAACRFEPTLHHLTRNRRKRFSDRDAAHPRQRDERTGASPPYAVVEGIRGYSSVIRLLGALGLHRRFGSRYSGCTICRLRQSSNASVTATISHGADVARASPVPVQMRHRRAKSRCRCGCTCSADLRNQSYAAFWSCGTPRPAHRCTDTPIGGLQVGETSNPPRQSRCV